MVKYIKSTQKRVKIILIFTLMVLYIAGYAQIEVRTTEDLNNVRNDMTGDYVQVADIDLDGIEWVPIGTLREPFQGNYDGRGHVIRNLTIETELQEAGLFGSLDGTVRNLGIEDANVNANLIAGALIGYFFNGTVEQCYAHGEVRGTRYVGVLIGHIGRGDSRNVVNSYAVGKAISEGRAGGLAGGADGGTITNSYAAVYVEGDPDLLGGLIGGQPGREEVINSFWDIEVSTVTEPEHGTGIRTGLMVQEITYNRLWDMHDVWAIIDGESYPYLQWQGLEPGNHNYPPDEGNPTMLVGEADNEQVSLSWQEPFAGEWVGYNVYRNEERLAQTGHDENEYIDLNLENYDEYSYYVTAVWEDERESKPTNTIKITPHLPFTGGDGTVANPFGIANARNLNDVRFRPDAHFIQLEDINLDVSPWNTEEGWEPIGHFVHLRDYSAFTGSFDGNGYVIDGLTIYSPGGDNLGLFGFVDNAIITDVTLVNVAITGHNRVGPLAVRVHGETTITNCRVSGDVEGYNEVGGLISYGNHVQLIDCHFDGTVIGHSRVAGLISAGGSEKLRIINCTVNGKITGARQFTAGVISDLRSGAIIDGCSVNIELIGSIDCGGIAGINSGTIRNSSFHGSISSNLMNVGGISGQTKDSGIVSNCFVDAQISGYANVGGIVGNHGSTVSPNVIIDNCYVHGHVKGLDAADSRNIGGIAGSSNGEISYCYSTAMISGPKEEISGILHNKRAGNVVSSYWDTETSGIDNCSGGGVGRMTEEMVYPYDNETFVGWDFGDIWFADENSDINNGYPYLRSNVCVSVENDDSHDYSRPSVTKLHSNYPNPFNPETTIGFFLADSDKILLEVFNARGQKIVTLIEQEVEAGNHYIIWNGRDENNSEVGSGVYFYRLQSSSYIDTKKMIMIK